MYQTNSSNSAGSSSQSNSFAHIQLDLWDGDGQAHNPDPLVIDQVFEHYHRTLKSQPNLSKLLTRRKIDPRYIDQFNIGFSDRTLGFELQSPKCLLGSRNRGHLQRLGLLKPSGHEFLRGAMVIPYRNGDGQIIGAYGRRPRHQRRSPAYHLYWNAQLVPFFNSTGTGLPESIVLCKSALDALTLLTAGVENSVATMGIRGFNDVQLSQLVEHGVRRVDIAFDNTPVANRYALLIAQALAATDIPCFRVELPLGQDINRFAMAQSDVSGAFNHLVNKAVPLEQQYGELLPQAKDRLLKSLETIEDCIAFYLEERRQADKSCRTLNTVRIHLERFQQYCDSMGIKLVLSLTSEDLDAYRRYLVSERNIFAGQVVSCVTQRERMETVARMLTRLYHYGILSEPLAFTKSRGSLH